MLDAKERAARLRELADLPSRHAEEDRGLRFLDGNIDAANPGIIHAVERLQTGARVDNGDAHFGAKLNCPCAGGRNGLFGISDRDMHDVLLPQFRLGEGSYQILIRSAY